MNVADEWAKSPVRFCPVHGIPDCSPLLNGCDLPALRFAAFEAGYLSRARAAAVAPRETKD